LPPKDTSKRLIVRQKAIRVLLDTGSSGDLLFLEKGSNKYIPIVSGAVPESWSTSNGTFKTKKVGEVQLSFVEYSASKKVHLHPDIVEYPKRGPPPLYNLIHPTSGLSGKTEVHVTPASVRQPQACQRPERLITTGQDNAKNTLVNRERCRVQIKINPRNNLQKKNHNYHTHIVSIFALFPFLPPPAA
jgi:hypothetical protein